MYRAECQNDGCDKEEWELKKHPKEYSSGVNCPECGTTKTVYYHVEDKQPTVEPEPQQAETQVQRRQPEQGHSQAPAQRNEDYSAGTGLADAVFTAANPEAPMGQRTDAVKALSGVALQFADRLNEYKDAREEAKRERARNVDIQESGEYPSCLSDGCQYTFEPDELMGEQAQCPQCGVVFDIV